MNTLRHVHGSKFFLMFFQVNVDIQYLNFQRQEFFLLSVSEYFSPHNRDKTRQEIINSEYKTSARK